MNALPERTLIVGDVHGMYDALVRVLDRADYRPSDRLVFLGDYVNRGPQSKEVLDLLVDLAGNPANIFLQGNHEAMILKLFGGRTEYWYAWLEYGGGRACLASYGVDPERIQPDGVDYVYEKGSRRIPLAGDQETTQFIADLFPESHLRFMLKTIASHETERFFFSHAGIETGVRLMAQNVYADCFLKWGDEDFLADETRYEKIIVFGHYHMKRPLLRPNRACIALDGSVGLLDLENMVVLDAEGTVTKIDPGLWY